MIQGFGWVGWFRYLGSLALRAFGVQGFRKLRLFGLKVLGFESFRDCCVSLKAYRFEGFGMRV